jgi:hypothetical protein
MKRWRKEAIRAPALERLELDRFEQITKAIRDMTKSAHWRADCDLFLRDMFAAFAVGGSADLFSAGRGRPDAYLKRTASYAYRLADYMMAERKKRARK